MHPSQWTGRPAWAEIDLDALEHNVRTLVAKAAPAQLYAVVKANAYGHGAIAVSGTAVQAGAAGLAVVCVDEGEELRRAGIDAPILLVGQAQVSEADGIVEPLAVAKILKAVADEEKPGLIILGKQAIDDDCNQTGQMLATLWGRPQATFASKLDVAGAKATVTREVDAGLEVIEVDLPAVVTTDLRLNEPRFIKLPDIMKAKSKPLETIAFDSLNVESGDHHQTTHYAAPAKRSKGVMVKDVPELVAALKAKGLL